MLQVWYNGSDHMIAESEEDAIKVWEEAVGDSWQSYAEEGEEWELDNKEKWTLWFEDEDDMKRESPTNAVFSKDKYGHHISTANQEDWINKIGRGWFCSEEW